MSEGDKELVVLGIWFGLMGIACILLVVLAFFR